LNAAFSKLVGGVVEAGWEAFFRGFLLFGLLSGVDVAVAARPLFLVLGSFFWTSSPRIASRPPTLLRYVFNISSADGLYEKTLSKAICKISQIMYVQQVLFRLPRHIGPFLIAFPFHVVLDLPLVLELALAKDKGSLIKLRLTSMTK
jgi:hypothetical protein